jgi:outer membrane protein assembly factor BamB
LVVSGTAAATRLFWNTALVAVLFCVCVTAALVIRQVRARINDPWLSPHLLELKEKLREKPNDEELKGEIRALDLKLRQAYNRQRTFQDTGGWMLVAGCVVLVWSGRQAVRCRGQAHQPRLVPDAAERQERFAVLARRAVIGVGGAVGSAFLALSFSNATALPRQVADVDKFLAKLANGGEEEATGPFPAALSAANWPQFLGPQGNSWASNSVLPQSWDVASGTGIRWRATLTNAGFNSPIVWSNRLFVSAGDARQREVFCYDSGTGGLLWRRPVANLPGSPAQPPEIPEGTGYAASSMATDGRRAFVIFGTGDLAAFRFDGTLAWAKHLGVPKNQYGHAASLVMWQDRLLVQLDQGEAAQNRSRLFAFDGATGRVVWECTRPVPESWATPCVAETPTGPQVVTLGGALVIAYAAKDGVELWRGEFLTGEIAPSPIFAGGLVLAVSPTDKLVGLRTDGRGDITQSHLAWKGEDNIPDITSPASNGDLVFLTTTYGAVTCYDVKDGKKQWEHEAEFEVNATPAIARDRLLLLGRKGEVLVAEAGRAFKQLARFEMGEPIFASPAFLADRCFIRTTQTLFCIGSQAPQPVSTQSNP